jgi:hypothetical protein
MQLTGKMEPNGTWTITDKVNRMQFVVPAYDCGDVYMTSSETGDVYLVQPPKPVRVTVEGFSMHFHREGKPEGVDLAHDHPIILAPCSELLPEERAFVYQSGGLGTIILVDNIIDPEMVSAAREAGQSDAFQAQGYEAFMRNVQGYDNQHSGKKCPEIESKVFSDRPDITVTWTLPETTVNIYCDTWLVVDDGKNHICINILTCGAKLEVDGDALHVYSGCPDAPSQDCP